MLNEGFGDADIDVVMRHVVSDAVGAPAQRQFAQVACSHHQRSSHVGQAEKMSRALSGLNVFKRDIVNFFPAGEGVFYVFEHLQAGRPDVDFVRFHAQRLHQPVRVFISLGRCGKTGHGVSLDVFARQLQNIHGFRRDHQCVR